MRYKRLVFTLFPALLLLGCVPKIDKAPVIKESDIQTDIDKELASYAHDNAQLKSDWWKGYGDAQLNQIIDTALSNAPSLKSIEARYAQANSIIQAVKSRNLPHLSADTSVIRERFSENHIFPPPLGGGSYNQYQSALALDYDFDFWNARSSHILSAKNQALAQRASIEASKIALNSAICETYLSWNYDQRKLEVLKSMEQTVREELRIVEKQYALGLIDAVAINEKKSSFSQVTQRMEELKRSIEGKKESICVLGGFLPSYASTMRVPRINDTFTPPLPKEILLNLLSHRPDVAVAKYTALSKSHTIERTKARFYPNISLSGLIGFTSFNWSKLFDHSSFTPSAGIALSLPLLDWGERNADLQNSVSDYNATVYEYNQAVVKAANEIVVLLKQSKLIQSQRQMHEEETAAKKNNATIALKRHHQGLSNRLPCLSAEKTVLESEIETLTLNETSSLIQIDLIKALGGGYKENADVSH